MKLCCINKFTYCHSTNALDEALIISSKNSTFCDYFDVFNLNIDNGSVVQLNDL